MNVRLFAALSLTLSLTSVACAQSSADASSVPPTAKPALMAGYGKLPLSFEANQGQVNKQVKFTSRGNGYSLFLTDTEAVLALTKPDPAAQKRLGRPAKLGAPFLPTDVSSATVGLGHSKPKNAATDVVWMELAGARHDLRVTGTEQLPGTANYFIGNDPAKWHSNVPTYAKVKYAGVYPGIDLVYYGNQRQLEYDFVVAPGADPKPVRLRFAGASRLKLDSNGDLRVIARNGEIAFHKPIVYQVVDGLRQPVAGRFTLLAKNAIGFTLDSYDHNRGLVIDPVLEYSTYLGGSGSDNASGVAVDAAGDGYITGLASTDFPVTGGAYQPANHGEENAYITKLNSSGTGLIYSTYLGGSDFDEGTGIAVDTAGNAFLTGLTASTDFPVTPGAFQMVNNAAAKTYNAFIAKLNPSGTGLVYSTYLGGSGIGSGNTAQGDSGTSIVTDAAGDAFVAGIAYSTDFPTTSGAFQTVNKAAANATANVFIVKLNPAGTGLIYSTYIGGSGGSRGGSDIPQSGDLGFGLAADAAGNTYVVGETFSADFPVTPGAFQEVNNAATAKDSAFITKLNPSGTALVYSTYLGGSGYNYGRSIAVDASGSAYLTGGTASTDFPVTSGAFQNVNNAALKESAYATNAFIAKLNPAGSDLVYSTYLGGSNDDVASGLAVDTSGNAHVTGNATSTDFPITGNAFQKVNNATQGFSNAFIAKLNPAGTALIYSTYLGGSAEDVGYGIAVDTAGDAYAVGETASTDFPVTSDAFQTINNAAANHGVNAFIAKLALGSFFIPQISEVSPDFGAPAAFVTITGNNFGETQGNGYVVVGGGRAQVTSWLATSITIRVPSTATTGNLYVSAGGHNSNGVAFTVDSEPSLSSISTTSGPAGAPVTFTGTNLTGAATVTFNGAAAIITSQTADQIQVTVPPDATSGLVLVLVNGIALVPTRSFVVPPRITSVSPNYGAPSAFITLTGSGFEPTQGYGLVIVGGARPEITAWSGTSITFRVPSPATTGNIVVETDRQTTNSVAFTVYSEPSITGLSVSSGPVGTSVTITGNNLLDGEGNATASFNGIPAAISSDTSGSIQVTVPAGATTGRLLVKVNGVAMIATANFIVTP